MDPRGLHLQLLPATSTRPRAAAAAAAAICAPPPAPPTQKQALKEKRSCKLVPECISAKQEVLTLVATTSDATAHVAAAAGGGAPVNCAPLSDLLARYAGSAQQRVDVWILDVEVRSRGVGLCDAIAQQRA